MSQPLFHAALPFALSALLLKLDGQSGQLAFIAAIISVLMDLDATLSPTREHETVLHSAIFLSATCILMPAFLLARMPFSIAVIPAVACITHIVQDILQGEAVHPGVLTRLIDVDQCHRPDIGRALDLASLPLALMAMLI